MILQDAIHTGYSFKRESWKADGWNLWLTVDGDFTHFLDKVNPNIEVNLCSKGYDSNGLDS